jgi:hypothetical protein
MSDDEYHRLLNELPKAIHGALTWTKLVSRIMQAGRRAGLSDIQIRDDAWDKCQGHISESMFRGLMPPTAKHQEKVNKRYALKISASGQSNSNNKEIDIPPPKQEIKEVVMHSETIQEDSHMEFRRKIELEPKPVIHETSTEIKQDRKPVFELVFDPAPIDRDRTQVFILTINADTGELIKYKAVGRKSIK